MADRKTHLIEGVKDKLQVITAKLTGGGNNAVLTADESADMGAGEIIPGARTGTGAHSFTMRKKYPELKALLMPTVWGTTAGLQCRILTFDVVAGSGTMQLEVGTVATDAASTDHIHLSWVVRNSGKNK